MSQINIHQAKSQLSRLVERAASGEEIIIAKAGKPVARLTAIEKRTRRTRRPGGLKGRLWVADDFDAPLSPEELAHWYDGKVFP
jgi:prevent-host-death family protein